jgi:hypothetical protein
MSIGPPRTVVKYNSISARVQIILLLIQKNCHELLGMAHSGQILDYNCKSLNYFEFCSNFLTLHTVVKSFSRSTKVQIILCLVQKRFSWFFMHAQWSNLIL